jgi:hypothetical protein
MDENTNAPEGTEEKDVPTEETTEEAAPAVAEEGTPAPEVTE